jgi:hypothetical protein
MLKSLLVAGAISLATAAPAPSFAVAPDQAAATSDKDPPEGSYKVVCRRLQAIGTRLASKRVCRTKAEWDADAAANRQDLERSQTQRWKSD